MRAYLLISSLLFTLLIGCVRPELAIKPEINLSNSFTPAKIKTIAILPFSDRYNRYGNYIAELFVGQLLGAGYNVTERSQLDKAFGELRLQYSGMLNEDQALKVGRISGADAVVLGSLLSLEEKTIYLTIFEYEAIKGKIIDASTFRGLPGVTQPQRDMIACSSISICTTVRMINVESGNVLMSTNYAVTYYTDKNKSAMEVLIFYVKTLCSYIPKR